MTKHSIKALVGATAAFALIAVGTAFINDAEVKASAAAPTAAITMEGGSIRYDTTGLRFGASMDKAEFEAIASTASEFEVGMLVVPESLLDGAELKVGDANAMHLTMTWSGTLVDEDNKADENGSKVLFKGFVDEVPLDEFETAVVGRAYYKSGSDYVYSAPMSRTFLYVAEEAYESATETQDNKDKLYTNHLKPYYMAATSFEITAAEACPTPSIIEDYDSANKALTVKMPKFGQTATTGQNAIRTTVDYAPGTYVMLEFLGKDHPGTIAFGDTSQYVSTGNYVYTGVGFWVDDFYQLSSCKGTSPTGREVKDSSSLLRRQYFEIAANANTKFVLIAGAEVDTADSKKTDLKYYLYAENNGIVSLRYSGSLEDVAFELTAGKIQVRTTALSANTEATIKMYQPDTLENINAKLSSIYTIDDAADKFVKTTNATVSTNADGSYQLNAPLISNVAYNYVATKAQYGSGTYLMAEFVGKNLPGMVLFGVDNVNATLEFSNTEVVYTKQATWNGVGLYTDYNFNSVTYYKAAAGTAVYTRMDGKFTRNGTSGIGTEDTYVLIAGAENSGADVQLTYTLYKKGAEGLTLFDTQTYTIENASVGTGSVVFTSSHQTGNPANIKLWTIGTKTEVETKLSSVYTLPTPEPTVPDV